MFAQDKLDLSFDYRPALSRYRADTATFLEHDFGLNLLLLLGAHTDITFAADAIARTGRERGALANAAQLATRRVSVRVRSTNETDESWSRCESELAVLRQARPLLSGCAFFAIRD